jgi:hypothetical protein
MRQTRLVGIALVAMLALGAIMVGVAAAAPEFLHEGKEVKTGFTASGKTTIMRVELAEAQYKITCTSASASGKITSTTKVEAVTDKFKGCKAKLAEEERVCEVKSISPEGKKEEIISKELKGKLGAVATSEAASGVGLKLEPASGEVYVTITGSTECLPSESSEIHGNLIGEITPIKKQQTTSELIYKVKSEKEQLVKKFTGETATHELEAFGVKAPVEGKDTITFEQAVEVT